MSVHATSLAEDGEPAQSTVFAGRWAASLAAARWEKSIHARQRASNSLAGEYARSFAGSAADTPPTITADTSWPEAIRNSRRSYMSKLSFKNGIASVACFPTARHCRPTATRKGRSPWPSDGHRHVRVLALWHHQNKPSKSRIKYPGDRGGSADDRYVPVRTFLLRPPLNGLAGSQNFACCADASHAFSSSVLLLGIIT